MSIISSVVPYASWLLDIPKHLWPIVEIGYDLYESFPLIKDWTQDPAARSLDLTLKSLLLASNFASAALAFRTCQHEQAVMSRVSSFMNGWKYGQEYLKGAAKNFLMNSPIYSRVVMNQNRAGLPEKEAQQIVQKGILFIQTNTPLYEKFSHFLATDDQKAASRVIAKLQLFSIFVCFGQFLMKEKSDASSSDFFVYHVLQYSSTALDCYLTASQTSAKTSSLAFETFHRIVGALPWVIRMIVACKVLYPLYLAGVELRKNEPIFIHTFCFVRYHFPPSPHDSSLQYPQIPTTYHQSAPFDQHICLIGKKPITQVLFIVEEKDKYFMFEKVVLVQYIFQSNHKLINPGSGKPFKIKQLYVDNGLNEKLNRHFLFMMKRDLQQN